MKIPELKDFSLVGGTALSLLYGHRKSLDLDLFSVKPFDNTDINAALVTNFGSSFEHRSVNQYVGIFGFVDDVKIDILRHTQPLIRPQLNFYNIRMFSIEDIIAMKVQAIFGRAKKKDFWDVAELLQHFTIPDFIKFHKEKFATQNLLITVPQALTYFAEAEESEEPISLNNQSWDDVKEFISLKVSEYLK
jgi:predicted nucleotidyltransferase component of viral defense system